jgi:hypothetical protein
VNKEPLADPVCEAQCRACRRGARLLIGSLGTIFILILAKKGVTSLIVLPDWKHSLANGTGSSGSEGECVSASPGISSEEVG